LSPVAVEALRAHGTQHKREKLAAGPTYADGLVFADEIGDPLDPPTVSAAFGRLVREAGLPRITLHAARHSFATIARGGR
jgi:integrase